MKTIKCYICNGDINNISYCDICNKPLCNSHLILHKNGYNNVCVDCINKDIE